jgi:YVTN family beta-propeller protein
VGDAARRRRRENTTTDALRHRISELRPGYRYRGANPNSLALSANGATLFVTLGGENAVAVIDVASRRVLGRIPTAWYPTSVSLSADGQRLFIVNLKSNSGPNPASGATTRFGLATNTTYRDEFVQVLQKGGLQNVPIPDLQTLGYLSAIVDASNGFYQRPGASPMMAYLHKRIKHVIYIMKENRSYDQMLGDLSVGNGDPRLTLFTRPITPNLHALAEQFVDLDNFYVSSDNSGDGWNWTFQGHGNDWTEETVPPAHDGEGFDFPSYFGTPHEIDLALPLFAGSANPELERITTVIDPSGSSTILPGTKDISATVGADDDSPGEIGGYLWDTVLRAGLTVRHYGLWDDTNTVANRVTT